MYIQKSILIHNMLYNPQCLKGQSLHKQREKVWHSVVIILDKVLSDAMYLQ